MKERLGELELVARDEAAIDVAEIEEQSVEEAKKGSKDDAKRKVA